MLELNGKKFAESNTEFTDSLFTKGGTCVGYAKRLKRQIKLFNMQNNLIGVINKYGVLCKATKTADGYWYSYGDIELLGDYKYSDEKADIEALTISRSWSGLDPVYQYK